MKINDMGNIVHVLDREGSFKTCCGHEFINPIMSYDENGNLFILSNDLLAVYSPKQAKITCSTCKSLGPTRHIFGIEWIETDEA